MSKLMNEDYEMDFTDERGESKVAFNSSGDIILLISQLNRTFISAMLYDDFKQAFKILVLKHSIIDFKLKPEERDELNEFEQELKRDLNISMQSYSYNGNSFLKYPQLKEDVEQRIIELDRAIKKLESAYGFGMAEQNDPRFAIMDG